eukprot:TRINITY_DN15584_c0_g1_i1.p1 TRINITY_DN15584_c0_g1~~TRINITY_DN15584_c0_g1_i1.p1  ORF type:complete len:234 (+),score=27.29 TRINITY_DN15584_c0_g1_i1:56-757(+)
MANSDPPTAQQALTKALYRATVIKVGEAPLLEIEDGQKFRFAYRCVKKQTLSLKGAPMHGNRTTTHGKPMIEVGDVVECRLHLTPQSRKATSIKWLHRADGSPRTAVRVPSGGSGAWRHDVKHTDSVTVGSTGSTPQDRHMEQGLEDAFDCGTTEAGSEGESASLLGSDCGTHASTQTLRYTHDPYSPTGRSYVTGPLSAVQTPASKTPGGGANRSHDMAARLVAAAEAMERQ